MDNNMFNENAEKQNSMNHENMDQDNHSMNNNEMMNQQSLNMQYGYPGSNVSSDFNTNMNMELDNAEQVNAKKILNKIGLAMAVMAGAILLSQFLISAILVGIFPDVEQEDWFVWVLTAVTMYGVGLPIFYGMTRKIPSTPKKPLKKLKIYQFLIIFVICTAAMYITNFISIFLTFLISLIKGGDILNPALDAIVEGNFLLTFLYTSIGAPIVEELIFRKILLDKVRRFGDLPAILITGLAFGLFHMNFAQIFYAIALGIIFAYVTLRTNTIRYTIILHILINTIGATVAPLVVKNGNMLLALLVGLWVITSIVIGTFLFLYIVVIKKNIQLDRGEISVPNKSAYLLNFGTILFVAICLAMTISVLLA